MDKKRYTVLPVFAAAAAGLAYSAYKGAGLFNRPRFQKQHDAVSRYISTHYPGAYYDPIQSAGSGWSTVIHYGKHNVALFLLKTEQGDFVFSEHE